MRAKRFLWEPAMRAKSPIARMAGSHRTLQFAAPKKTRAANRAGFVLLTQVRST